MLTLEAIALSETGLVRKTNQDSGYVSGRLLLVADGMGGAAAGDLASATVVRHLRQAAKGVPDNNQAIDQVSPTDDQASGQSSGQAASAASLELLGQLTEQANAQIARLVRADHELDGMGTTVCGGLLTGHDLNIVHIGDSRGYLLSDGELRRLTHDHSYVQSLIDEGRLDERRAMTHPHRSLILKVLNGQPDIQPDYFCVPVRPGDRVMFCSDGLCGLVGDAEILAVLKLWDRERAMEALVELAYAAGGTDNITIVLADVVEQATTPTSDQDTAEQPLLTIPSQPLGMVPDGDLLAEAESAEVVPGSAEPEETMPLGSVEPPAMTGPAPIDPGLIGAAADPKIINLLEKLTALAATLPVLEEPTARLGRPAKPSRAPGRTSQSERAKESNLRLSPAALERQRYTPTVRRRRWGIWVVAAVILVVLGGTGWGVYEYVSHQFYVGAADGRVAIYQGLPGSVAGIETSRVYERTNILLNDLPISLRDKVLVTLPVGDINQARASVGELTDKSQQCLQARASRRPGDPVPQDGC